MLAAHGIQILGKDLYVFCAQLKKVIILTPDINRKFKIIIRFEKSKKNTFRRDLKQVKYIY